MHKNVIHNDRLLPLEQVHLSPGQAGLLSGWGLFTTMRIYAGRAFAFDRHWRRLSADGERIGLPVDYSAEKVHERLCEVIQANNAGESCARIYFVYNKVGFWHSEGPYPKVDLLIYTSDLPVREGSARLGVEKHARHSANPLTGTKVTSWLQNVWALDRATRRGLDESVLLNERGEVTECTAANLFAVLKGKVITPPLSAGCLAGVTRAILLEIAPQADLPIAENALILDDLLSADEVFLTSTTREVQPVSEIEGQTLPASHGAVTQRLGAAFSAYVARYFAEQDLRLKEKG